MKLKKIYGVRVSVWVCECVFVCMYDVFCYSLTFYQLYAYPVVPSEPYEGELEVLPHGKLTGICEY